MTEQILRYLDQAGAAISLAAVAVIVAGFALASGRYALRFGKLASYDTSLRIGAHRGLWPRWVYLHTGTRTGAKALNLDISGVSLEVSDLPGPLRRLQPYEVEDFLCIYKQNLKTGRLLDSKTRRHGRC